MERSHRGFDEETSEELKQRIRELNRRLEAVMEEVDAME
jgi:hypothetical protein